MNVYLSYAEHSSVGLYLCRTVLVLDVSGSMDQADWPPSRLAGAVQAASQLIDVKAAKYPNDQFGVVTFSNVAVVRHPVAPISSSEASLRAALSQISAGGCTALTDGLVMGVKQLSECSVEIAPPSTGAEGACAGGRPQCADVAVPTVRQIVVLTDGQHNEGPDPVPYAQEVKRAGFVVDVVGIGTQADLDQTCLKAIASPKLDGTPRYCFIGDAQELSSKLRELAHHYIQPL
jgi:Ca-activated chloride channel family protein